jgi:hypothetical protein
VNSFVQKHRSQIIGVLSGFDRLARRTEVSQAVNDRYLDALASCEGFHRGSKLRSEPAQAWLETYFAENGMAVPQGTAIDQRR